MPLSPLDALTVASATVQFVDFGTKLIANFLELYRSNSALAENVDLEELTQDLSNLSEKLTSAPQLGTPTGLITNDELALQKLANSSTEVANELLFLLRDLKVQASGQKWQTLRQALRSMYKKDKIENLKSRLDRLQSQLNSRLLAIMSDRQSSVLSTLDDLLDANQRLETSTTSKLNEFRLDLYRALKQPPRAIDGNVAFFELSAKLSNLAQEGKKVTTEQDILKNLRFDSMRMRHLSIKEATPKTFEWIYQQPAFSTWLQSRNGTYWIAGKAGSGKSTLMKFLCDHVRTKEALKTWAASADLVVASYFFWNAGNLMQKSQEGLLRSLLYQILRQCPSLILTVCQARAAAEDPFDGISDPWTRQELSDSFEQLAKQTLLTTKFCFFVDGLDEYDGDKTDLINIITGLAKSPSVKVCLSSRPWNVFLNAFGQNTDRMLLVQEFTKNDIKHHIEVRLGTNPRYAELKNTETAYKNLVEEIAEKAQGVFLWVYLVVGSLLRGMEEQDEIADLQSRLDLLPEDLEEYFQHIFDRIEHAYQQQTAQIFQITVQTVQPLSVLALSFLDREKIDPEYALNDKVPILSDVKMSSIYAQVKKRLNARCKDLLEVNEYDDDDTFQRYRVDFLHRTVRDFLQSKDMQEMLKTRAGVTFDARISLCRMFLAQIKALHFETGIEDRLNCLFALIDEFMYYAGEVEVYNGQSQVALLDELDRVVSYHAKERTSHWTNARDAPAELFEEYGHKTFLAEAIQARLKLYVTQKLDSRPRLLHEKKGRPLLDYALRPTMVTPIHLPYQDTNIDASMVLYLLEKGASPNQQVNIYNWRTVWDLFLVACHETSGDHDDPRRNQIYQVAEMLIRKGADPNLRCVVGRNTSTTARYKRPIDTVEIHGVSEILKAALPSRESALLEALLEEKRRSWPTRFWKLVGWV